MNATAAITAEALLAFAEGLEASGRGTAMIIVCGREMLSSEGEPTHRDVNEMERHGWKMISLFHFVKALEGGTSHEDVLSLRFNEDGDHGPAVLTPAVLRAVAGPIL